MSTDKFSIKLENIFEGPMDLLIHLIKKNEVDIYDIPIALLTDQYLEYLEWMKEMNIDFAGDFVVMAATLTQIKSRMLIPVHQGDDDEEDLLLEITKPLMEYLEMKFAAEQLAGRNLLGEDTFARLVRKDQYLQNREEEEIQIGLFELIDAFKKILDSVSDEEKINFFTEEISIRERISEIVDLLEKKGSISFDELFTGNADKSQIVVTFLATLEMVKLNLIRIVQHVQTRIIRLFYL